MFKEFFRLTEQPFSAVCDPKFNFVGDQHVDALRFCLTSFNNKQPMAVLLGEQGVGKSTFAKLLSARLADCFDIVPLDASESKAKSLPRLMLEALNIWLGYEVSDERVFQQLAQAIQQHKACEKKWVFLVDDAHVLTEIDLNHCCHLFSLLHNSLGAAREDACFHIVLIGQPPLMQQLKVSNLSQLNCTKSGGYPLSPFDEKDTLDYVRHRLTCAGSLDKIFTTEALKVIVSATQGNPTNINHVCEKSLEIAFQRFQREIDVTVAKEACELICQSTLPLPTSELPKEKQQMSLRLAVSACVGLLFLLTTSFAVFELDVFNLFGSSKPSLVARPTIQQADFSVDIADEAVSVGIPEITAKEMPAEKYHETPQVIETTLPTEPSNPDAPYGLSELLLSEAQAVEVLQKWWGAQGDAPRCGKWQKNALSCLTEYADLSTLSALNMPVALSLHDAKGQRGFAIVYAIVGDQVKLLMDGTRRRMHIDELHDLWNGETRLLWFAPNIEMSAFNQSGQNASKDWVSNHLAQYFERSGTQFFEDNLIEKIKAFQFAEGLAITGKPDGVTLIMLDAQNRPNRPNMLQSVEDSAWENWLLTEKGLLQSFDVITNVRSAKIITSEPVQRDKDLPVIHYSAPKESEVAKKKVIPEKKVVPVKEAPKPKPSTETQPKSPPQIVKANTKSEQKTASIESSETDETEFKTVDLDSDFVPLIPTPPLPKGQITGNEIVLGKKDDNVLKKVKTASTNQALSRQAAASTLTTVPAKADLMLPADFDFSPSPLPSSQPQPAKGPSGEKEALIIEPVPRRDAKLFETDGELIQPRAVAAFTDHPQYEAPKSFVPSLYDIDLDRLPPELAEKVRAARKAKEAREGQAHSAIHYR